MICTVVNKFLLCMCTSCGSVMWYICMRVMCLLVVNLCALMSVLQSRSKDEGNDGGRHVMQEPGKPGLGA